MIPAETAIRQALAAGPTFWKCKACGSISEVSGAIVGDNWCSSCGACDTMEGFAACNPAAMAELLAEMDRLRAEQKALTSGDRLWLWQDGDRYLAFRHEFPCYSPGGDPMTLGNPAPVVVEFRESHDRAHGITGD